MGSGEDGSGRMEEIEEQAMPWLELSLDTAQEAVDWVCTLLATMQTVTDLAVMPYAESALDHCESAPADWAFTLRFYLPYDGQARSRVAKIDELLSALQRTGLATALRTAIASEKAAAPPHPLIRRIGAHFVVLAPDAIYTPESTQDIPLRLATTLSFGSGFHPATMCCLRLLERHVLPTMQALDLGSGSGILSVAIAKLGATVLALDNDPVAVQATRQAIRENGVEPRAIAQLGSLGGGSELGHWMGGDLLTEVPALVAPTPFNLIVANILARVHIALADDYRRALCHADAPGLLITSGFTDEYEADVSTALQAQGFVPIDCDRDREWVAFAYRTSDQPDSPSSVYNSSAV